MPAALVFVVVVAAVATAVLAPTRTALAVLVGVTFLVPDSLVLPYAFDPALNAQRLVLAGFVAGLVRTWWHGGVGRAHTRITSVHVALLALLAVAAVDGVLLARPWLTPTATFNQWLLMADQVVFFGAVLVAVRRIRDAWWVARLVVGVLAVTAVVAVVEHGTRASWSQWVFAHLPEQSEASGARPVELRGGDVRVRAGASFALAYGWSLAVAFPLAAAVAAVRRRWWTLAPALLGVALVWTYARSALVGVAVGLVLLAVFARLDRRVAGLLAAGAVVVLVAALATGAFARAFDPAAAAGSSAARSERLPVVLGATADRPFVGTGLGGVPALGYAGTDASYVQTYVELGAFGVAALVLVLMVTLAAVAPALLAAGGDDRVLGAAVLAGLVTALGGAAAFDLFPTAQGSKPFWLLAAVGVFLAEQARPRASLALPPVRRLLLPLAGVAVGLVVVAAGPKADAVTMRFRTLSAAADARAATPRDFVGRTEARTACAVLSATAAARPGTAVDCVPLPGTIDAGQVRIAVHGSADLDAEVARLVLAAAGAVPGFAASPVAGQRSARPAWVATAPVALGSAGLALAVLAPVGVLAPADGRRRWKSLRRAATA